jgi:hypothetical protein
MRKTINEGNKISITIHKIHGTKSLNIKINQIKDIITPMTRTNIRTSSKFVKQTKIQHTQNIKGMMPHSLVIEYKYLISTHLRSSNSYPLYHIYQC